jgi:hypothetical protein
MKFHYNLPAALHPPNGSSTFRISWKISVTISHLPMPAICPVHHTFLTSNAVAKVGKGIRYKQLKSITVLKTSLTTYLYITIFNVSYNCFAKSGLGDTDIRTAHIT